MTDQDLAEPPRTLGYDRYITLYGGVYEHSPWIARGVWEHGLDAGHDTVDGLASALREVLESASRDDQLAVLRAHPDLADRAAQRNQLTDASSEEQTEAGLDQCSRSEYERFQSLNRDYKERFGFPLIMAVKGYHRREILAAFEARVANDWDTEFRTALDQVHRIARLRLTAFAAA